MSTNLNSSIKCPLCGIDVFTSHTYNKNIKLYICENCGLIFKPKNLYLEADLELNRYNLHQDPANDLQNEKRLLNIYQNYILPFKQTGNLLDYGSGQYKTFLNLIKDDKKFSLFSFDLYYDNNEQYMKTKYDVIVLIEVIEHIQKLCETMTNLVDLLNNDGILVISTKFITLESIDSWYIRDITHYQFFNNIVFNYLESTFKLKMLKTDNTDIIVLMKHN